VAIHLSRPSILLVAGFQLISAQVLAQSAKPPNAISRSTGAQKRLPVSDWLSWKVFHQNHIVLSESGTDARMALANKFGVSPMEAEYLVRAGRQYVAAIRAIDADARALVQSRYGTDRVPPLSRRPDRPAPPASRPIRIRPGAASLLEMVRQDGLFDEIESRKERVFGEHKSALQAGLSPKSLADIQAYVTSEVAAHIVVVDRGIPGSKPPLTSPLGGTFFRNPE
jgi:hypothetical protein